ncbi:HNH endonuclease family protein [Streptomyces rochei]|uniref:HNH endonuclease family protein n=1 Tax=Streptomyces vinaceusdrappus TaxID=67376 RepID=A0ABY6BUF1_9ACTN|nr:MULTISPECIES: HNH endonuclease family protein [Streptomyces]UXI79166.1 HNH endonuclease family protein [Streptomyces vinaceusdrappus]WDI18821.1 HNH endonuclease family protein [Streptomyces enissocaesilis]WMI58914.1 HNH endonuclease family protein [Streptomyces rochei]
MRRYGRTRIGGRHVGGRRIGGAACAVLALALVTGCEGADGSGPATTDEGAGAPAAGRAVSPLRNPDGTGPGLAPVTGDADRAKARELIDGLTTKGRGPRTGYDRDEFGYAWMDTADGVPYARNGCDTRNDLLRRDGQELRFRSGSDCVVVAMTLDDPYTGTTIEWRKQKASEVQIDHVVPLSYSWQMGSSRWSEGKREQLANDPLNLIPVQGRANSAKSDSGPASWLPPDKSVRCAYAVRFAQVAAKYELAVTAPDKRMMSRQCGG